MITIWVSLLEYEDSFEDVADFALAVLSLPHSNTECERVSS